MTRENFLLDDINERELQVIELLAEGLTNREIADRIYLAVSTVKWYITQINSKLDTTNRQEIVDRANELDLLTSAAQSQDGFARPKQSLPRQTTAFIGRDSELDELHALLENPDIRLLTILAPGGMGKTRLAIATAEQQSDNFEHGVCFIPLARTNDVSNIIYELGERTGYQFQQDWREPQQQVLDYLQDKHMLLIMDNFEHVLDGRDFVHELLLHAPDVRMIVTSRERLHLQAETVYSIAGLLYPQQNISLQQHADYSALQLFERVARRESAKYEVSDDDLPHIVRICDFVRGMPLGIKLAAGWVDVLSPQEIADELQRGLDLLETEFTDIPERQRSIRSVLKQSWDRLSEKEQSILMHLAAFCGGCTRDAAESVANASLFTLQSLVNKAMLNRTGDGRYELHELLRQYANEQRKASHDTFDIEEAHAAYYSQFMDDALELMESPKQKEVLEAIEADYDNIIAAWDWALQHRSYDLIESIYDSLYIFCHIRRHPSVGTDLFERAREALAPTPGESAHPIWAVTLIRYQSVNDDQQSIVTALNILRDYSDYETGICYFILGSMAEGANDFHQALNHYNEAYKLFADHKALLGDVVTELSHVYRMLGDFTMSRRMIKNAYELHLQIGDPTRLTRSLSGIADDVMFADGDYKRAEQYLHQALKHAEAIDNTARRAKTYAALGRLAFRQGDFELTRHYAQETWHIAHRFKLSVVEMEVAKLNSLLALVEEDYETATIFYQQVLEYNQKTKAEPYDRPVMLGLSMVACGQKDFERAHHLIMELLHSEMKLANPFHIRLCLPIVACILAERGASQFAVKLLARAMNSKYIGSNDWLKQIPLFTNLAHQLEDELGSARYQALWQEGSKADIRNVVEDILNDTNRNAQDD